VTGDVPAEAPTVPRQAFIPPDVRHLPMRVLHADDAIAVVVKPPELLSCPGTSTPNWDSVTLRAQELFPHATGPLLVHRLDAPTSGLMVLALTAASHKALSHQFAKRVVSKQYDAVCEPISLDVKRLIVGDSGALDLSLRLDWPRRPLQIVDAVRGKAARTEWKVVATNHITTDALHLRLAPITGRTHQLRVHLAIGLGYPIIGDRLYGRDPAEALHSRQRLRLHASALAFTHPSSGERMAFVDRPDFLET